MHTLGHGFVPEPIHAGGLRYHGMAPMVSHLVNEGLVEAGRLRPERVLPRGGPLRARRGHHPGAGAVARDPRGGRGGRPGQGGGTSPTILFNLCGHGHFDLAAYDAFLAGKLEDRPLAQEELDRAAEVLAGMPALG